MEKKYTLVEIRSSLSALTGTCGLKSDTYPFKTYLFEEAVKAGKTDMTDKDEFNRNIEIYKKLKEALYFDNDSISVPMDEKGTIETFTMDEASSVVSIMEDKVQDVETVLLDIRNRASELLNNPRIVVYTCITGGYDNLKKLSVVTSGIDYVCFTDSTDLKSDIWQIRPIPEELLGYSKVKQQRGVKILPHRYLSEYDISVWIDANVDMVGDVKAYLNGFDFKKYSVFIPEHPARKCIYKEKDACVKIRKIKGEEVTLAEKQMSRYKAEKFPENDGLVQSNIVIRAHNSEYSKKIMELWWSELKDYSHRDQLSFNYALWKVGKEHFKALAKTTCNSSTFKWGIGHKKK